MLLMAMSMKKTDINICFAIPYTWKSNEDQLIIEHPEANSVIFFIVKHMFYYMKISSNESSPCADRFVLTSIY